MIEIIKLIVDIAIIVLLFKILLVLKDRNSLKAPPEPKEEPKEKVVEKGGIIQPDSTESIIKMIQNE